MDSLTKISTFLLSLHINLDMGYDWKPATKYCKNCISLNPLVKLNNILENVWFGWLHSILLRFKKVSSLKTYNHWYGSALNN